MPVNIKNPAIKRIHADVRELTKDPSDQYYAAPLETNLFEWHFTVRGPPDTEFEGGVYHGRILLPPEYPFRPPDIVFNTPNGRFNVGMKVCLSISSFHPEYWQPAWGIRLILEALISFFPSPSRGALGGLDWTKEERKKLAVASHEWKCYKCGLAKDLVPELRAAKDGDGKAGAARNSYADQIKELHKLKVKTTEDIAAEEIAASGAAGAAAAAAANADTDTANAGTSAAAAAAADESDAAPTIASSGRGDDEPSACLTGSDASRATENAEPSEGANQASSLAGAGSAEEEVAEQLQRENACESVAAAAAAAGGREAGKEVQEEDDVLMYFAVAISLAIAGILIRKGLRYLGLVL